jgi:hypothetical protein
MYVQSLCPPVRELVPGERPRDWANDGFPGSDGVEADVNDSTIAEPSPAAPARELLPPAPAELPPVTGPQQYQMQFSTTEEHVHLVERAKALLAREQPGAALGELHVQAMRLLVASLEKKKFAVTGRPGKPTKLAPTEQEQKLLNESAAGASQPEPSHDASPPRRRVSRHVPAAERREVFRRDGGRCSYVDSRGERCCETRYLELHHLKPFARGGATLASNLTLRCSAHNALAAEEDFGREHMAQKRDSLGHESWASQAQVITSR